MAKNVLTAWQRLMGLLKLDRRDVLQTFYYAIFAGLVNLSLPLGIQSIINLIQGAEISTSWIILVVLVTGGVAFAGILRIMQMRIVENMQQKIFTRASFEFTYRFPKIKMSELRDYYPPELANRFFDTLNVQKGLSKLLLDVPAALLQIVFGLLLLSFYHPFFIIYGILLLVLVYLVFRFTVQKGMDTSLDESKSKYKVAHWIQEVARSLVSFKLSGRTSLAVDKNDVLVTDYLKARESHFRVLLMQFVQLIGFKVLVTAGLLIIGGLLVLNQEMNIGQFVAAEIIILLVITSVEKLIRGFETFYDLLTSLEKLGQVVDKDLEDQEGTYPLDENEPLTVELNKVSFRTNSKDNILSDISLRIIPGSRQLIVGANGSGKSTLLRLIAGIIEPNEGTVYVNDFSLSGINSNHYRSFLGQSMTEESPFEGTILENITFGDQSISHKDLHWAMESVGLLQFVKEQPNGLDTIIHPEGQQIPYTVARKIVLARSIVRKPKLLLLNDPLNQFDEPEAQRLMTFLTDTANPWALVVVSQDLRWAVNCQNIITMNQGRIVSIK
ncbi:ABC-type bacteriocin/lantibiotic exporter, contains an N-terminal double-glycine peptidase domain [Zobellia uliginosa]|uniref:ABC-type bacteriocin/lantibiotic exporter, contains an N-terminal double-glycine peptidase domain n=1 Tax=Zobellia uliginosa TaxID=143224 RepID=A0ABY1L105_9FLAO|nr:ATP-binding cassette domain-containing protein [Zobellia uliginosa]SIS86227.1 ABC-type bacteriocin/lantibiotic exporter, contains an N-terminal double-glycine peptidase domain [Zobellia uliginosa]